MYLLVAGKDQKGKVLAIFLFLLPLWCERGVSGAKQGSPGGLKASPLTRKMYRAGAAKWALEEAASTLQGANPSLCKEEAKIS